MPKLYYQSDMMYFFNRAQEFQEKQLQGQNLAVTDVNFSIIIYLRD